MVGEADSLNFLGVSNESHDTLSVSNVPKSEGFIPRAGDDVGVIVRNSQVSDEVVVTGESLLWDTKLVLSFGFSEVPDDERFIS